MESVDVQLQASVQPDTVILSAHNVLLMNSVLTKTVLVLYVVLVAAEEVSVALIQNVKVMLMVLSVEQMSTQLDVDVLMRLTVLQVKFVSIEFAQLVVQLLSAVISI